ncbi:serine/threonine-protein kinase [Roseofilum sp. BLCC_M154]|uniref:non-specific serine/threonine protein kinase n=1 Tax=Roseofilum acuticapitatum BLCC-M154 TaxID=3022444 RepID=A0ABT7AZX6_9CYAN|nr:serine/threonine-protein kinase [Roseofilum acuticapitatum]MDJ1172117.1 serine/threonine-protein kinase [Roseofilum acuticapitatum BLCC-M154]
MANEQASNKLLQFPNNVTWETDLARLCGEDELFRDRYQMYKLLGRGGFGVTFLAKDLGANQQPWCVIKQLCPKVKHAKGLERARRCFRREAKILSQLGNHPQIPQMFDYFEEEGEFYLVQEYIQGRTLSREIRHYGQYTEKQVKSFLLEILPLLKFIHEQGVIHRDIKPPNIIRRHSRSQSSTGELVLIDFGAVKYLIQETESNHTITATASTAFVGTFGFSPPEQLALRPTFASDLYALGITCVYMLTGQFSSDDDLPHFRPKQWWRNNVEVSDQFADVIDQLLAVDLDERYRSAQEVLTALDLAPHLESLNECLTHQPQPKKPEPQEYISPAQKRAQEIRARMERLQKRQKLGTRNFPQHW